MACPYNRVAYIYSSGGHGRKSGEVDGGEAMAAELPERGERQKGEEDEDDIVVAREVDRQSVESLVDVDEEVPADGIDICKRPKLRIHLRHGKGEAGQREGEDAEEAEGGERQAHVDQHA